MSDPGWRAEDWIMLEDAVARIDRDAGTIYRWIKTGKVKTFRPGIALWCYLPDLLILEATRRRRRKLDK